MSWYWIVLLCVTSGSLGALLMSLLMSLLTAAKIAELYAALDASTEAMQLATKVNARMREELECFQRIDDERADALHGGEVR